MTVNGGYILLLYSRFLLSNNLLFTRTKGYHGSKKFTEKLYAFAMCTPKKIIPNFSPSNVRAVRTPSATRIVLTLYISSQHVFFKHDITYIYYCTIDSKKIQRKFFDHNRYKNY